MKKADIEKVVAEHPDAVFRIKREGWGTFLRFEATRTWRSSNPSTKAIFTYIDRNYELPAEVAAQAPDVDPRTGPGRSALAEFSRETGRYERKVTVTVRSPERHRWPVVTGQVEAVEANSVAEFQAKLQAEEAARAVRTGENLDLDHRLNEAAAHLDRELHELGVGADVENYFHTRIQVTFTAEQAERLIVVLAGRQAVEDITGEEFVSSPI